MGSLYRLEWRCCAGFENTGEGRHRWRRCIDCRGCRGQRNGRCGHISHAPRLFGAKVGVVSQWPGRRLCGWAGSQYCGLCTGAPRLLRRGGRERAPVCPRCRRRAVGCSSAAGERTNRATPDRAGRSSRWRDRECSLAARAGAHPCFRSQTLPTVPGWIDKALFQLFSGVRINRGKAHDHRGFRQGGLLERMARPTARNDRHRPTAFHWGVHRTRNWQEDHRHE